MEATLCRFSWDDIVMVNSTHLFDSVRGAIVSFITLLFFADKYETAGEKLLNAYNVLRYEES